MVEIPLGIGSGRERRFVEYGNIDRSIAVVVSSRLATMHELQTVYGFRDLYDLLEIIAVDNHNQRIAASK